ncbi:MAG: NUDIX hydrolase [Actinomycetes bacterium]
MAAGDGNGWVQCRCGHRHWGLFGAAGLLLVRSEPAGRRTGDPTTSVLLQLRAVWTHHGGTWGLPGGARDSHEDAATAALREAHEETDVPPRDVHVLATVVTTDHVDWTYEAVVGVPAGPVSPHAVTRESEAVRWVAVDEVDELPLHPGFQASWAELRECVSLAAGPAAAVRDPHPR